LYDRIKERYEAANHNHSRDYFFLLIDDDFFNGVELKLEMDEEEVLDKPYWIIVLVTFFSFLLVPIYISHGLNIG
jgi:hypothetical protein